MILVAISEAEAALRGAGRKVSLSSIVTALELLERTIDEGAHHLVEPRHVALVASALSEANEWRRNRALTEAIFRVGAEIDNFSWQVEAGA